jgi:hypothetical protein
MVPKGAETSEFPSLALLSNSRNTGVSSNFALPNKSTELTSALELKNLTAEKSGLLLLVQ